MNRIVQCLTIAALSAGLSSLASAMITPNPFAFGDIEVGDSSPAQIFTMTNPLAEQITIVSTVIGGANPEHYVLDVTTCTVDTVIDPGGNCTITVRFAPSAAGNQVALIRVSYTAPPPNPPGVAEFNAVLFGNGTEPPPPPPPPADTLPVPALGWAAIAIAAVLLLAGAALTRRSRLSDRKI